MNSPLLAFRTFAASVSCRSVARDIQINYVPFIVVRREEADFPGKVFWYTFSVDDQLLHLLNSADADLNSALGLHEHEGNNYKVIERDIALDDILTKAADRAYVLLDQKGNPFAVHSGEPWKPSTRTVVREGWRGTSRMTSATLFPRIQSLQGYEVDQDEVMEFCLEMPAAPGLGAVAPLQIVFPNGIQSVEVYAEVSSKEFSPPKGETWRKRFLITRKLSCDPAWWNFTARAIGDRPTYSLTISFQALGTVLQSLVFTAARKGVPLTTLPTRRMTSSLELPTQGGAEIVVQIAEQGGKNCRISLYENGRPACEPTPWVVPESGGFDYYQHFEEASSLDKLKALGIALHHDLPANVRNFLEQPKMVGRATLFISDGRVAPFEIMQLNPEQDGPFLGVDRPVARWINDKMADQFEMAVPKVGCIRPSYKTDPLPSAEQEEIDLAQCFPNISHVRCKSDFEALLDDESIKILHFAGHSSGNPAGLVLEDDRITPDRFLPSRKLVLGRPLFMINGCRAGQGRSAVSSIIGNYAKFLLQSGFSAIVASAIAINSEAGRRAAREFYRAILNKKTIAEAVQDVRKISQTDGISQNDVATYLSYLAIAPPMLRFKVHVGS